MLIILKLYILIAFLNFSAAIFFSHGKNVRIKIQINLRGGGMITPAFSIHFKFISDKASLAIPDQNHGPLKKIGTWISYNQI